MKIIRQLTLLVEVEQPKANWIWETHGNGKEFHGVLITRISDGDVVKELETELEDREWEKFDR